MSQQKTVSENIAEKGEIARYEQFLRFPQNSLLNQITVSSLLHIFDIMSLFTVELKEPKIGILDKGLSFILISFSGLDDMDEKVYDPRTLFAEVGLLITEARTPELSKKGRVEGPHCPPISGLNAHECDRHKEQVRMNGFFFLLTIFNTTPKE